MDEAVGSVLAQTHPHWELLIIDDGSSDSSLSLAEGYARSDERIRVLQHPDKENHGLAATIQLGLAEARYPFVAFLEADDAWEASSLAERLPVFGESGTALVFNRPFLCVEGERDASFYADQNAVLENVIARRKPPQVHAAELFATNLIPSFSCVIANKAMLLACDFNTPSAPLLDKWLWQQMAFKGVCRYVDKPLTRWRLHPGSYIASRKGGAGRERRPWDKATADLLRLHVNREFSPSLWGALYFPSLHRLCVCGYLKMKALGAGFLWKAFQKRLKSIVARDA